MLYAPQALSFELLCSGAAPETYAVSRDEALQLVRDAADALSAVGLAWPTEEHLLTPAPRLAELIRRSRDLTEQKAPETADVVAGV